jgi:hypothetical protein
MTVSVNEKKKPHSLRQVEVEVHFHGITVMEVEKGTLSQCIHAKKQVYVTFIVH